MSRVLKKEHTHFHYTKKKKQKKRFHDAVTSLEGRENDFDVMHAVKTCI